MQEDCITVKLRLPGLVVLGVEESQRWIEVAAQYGNEEGICPMCGRSTWQVHQWHLQRKRDAKLWGKEVWIALFKRRFRCRGCGKVFMEPDPVCGPRRRTTRRLRSAVARRAREATVRSVAREEGVSEGLVERSWLEAHTVPLPPEPHALLGLDSFCVRRPGRMWTGLWDLESKWPVAFVPGERQRDVERMLERHAPRDTVRAVAIDLSEPYRQAIQMVLPDAAVVADKFHVLALAGQALREVHGEKRRPGTVAWLLQRGMERLSQPERARLLEALSADPRLARAWGLKEALREVYRKKRWEDAAAALERWIREAQGSELQPFRRTAGTLRRWQKEVLNLLALPHYQRPGGGQAQPREGPEKEGLWLPQRQELSAKNP